MQTSQEPKSQEAAMLRISDKELDAIKASIPSLEDVQSLGSNSNDSLILTDEEESQSTLSAGIRGQIKKVLRSLKDDFVRPMLIVEKNQSLLSQQVKQFNETYHVLYSSTSRRFEKQFSYLVNMFLIRLENRVHYHEIRSKAMLDELLVRLHKLENATKEITKDDYLNEFETGINNHEISIRAKLKELEEAKKNSPEQLAANQEVIRVKEEAFGNKSPATEKEKEEVTDGNQSKKETWQEETSKESLIQGGGIA